LYICLNGFVGCIRLTASWRSYICSKHISVRLVTSWHIAGFDYRAQV